MPVIIGAKKESSFADPIGLLQDCHRRIERFLSILVKVSGHASLDDEHRQALETALRYFRDSSPKHTADEEQSLFPRLRAINRPEVQAALANVDALENDHARAGQIHAELDRRGKSWLVTGSLSPDDTQRFSALVAELSELYRGHIAIEEREVFPLAARALDTVERRTIGEEMALRRGLDRSGRHD